MILITLKNELNVYRAVHIGKLFGMSPNKKIFTSLKKPKGHKFKFKLQELINIIQQDKTRYERRLGVTTENGKNSTLSDLVFVKVIDN